MGKAEPASKDSCAFNSGKAWPNATPVFFKREVKIDCGIKTSDGDVTPEQSPALSADFDIKINLAAVSVLTALIRMQEASRIFYSKGTLAPTFPV